MRTNPGIGRRRIFLSRAPPRDLRKGGTIMERRSDSAPEDERIRAEEMRERESPAETPRERVEDKEHHDVSPSSRLDDRDYRDTTPTSRREADLRSEDRDRGETA